MHYRLSVAAQADIINILAWTHEQFGEAARKRYEALIVAGLRDIAVQPARPSSLERHFLIYRRLDSEYVVVGRVLHDAMELAHHLDSDHVWE